MDPRLNKAGRSRRRLQFSLRSLLVLVLGCGLACGWFTERMNTARRQREAVRFLLERWAFVTYDDSRLPDGTIRTNVLMAPKVALVGPSRPSPWLTLTSRLQSLLRDDLFRTVVRVDFYCNPGPCDDDLKAIVRGLPRLEELHINDVRLTDDGLLELNRLSGLRVLGLEYRCVDNCAVASLRRLLPNLTVHCKSDVGSSGERDCQDPSSPSQAFEPWGLYPPGT
jgi:hypothetical protein